MNNNELGKNNPPSHAVNSKNSNKSDILAQNTGKAKSKLQRMSAHQFKLRWILAISCLPLFGIYAAFGIAPQTLTANIATTTITEEITIPAVEATAQQAAEQDYWYKDHVRRDDTLSSLLSRLNIRNREALDFIRNDKVASEIASNLKPNNAIEAQSNADGDLISLEYELSSDEFISVNRSAVGYQASKAARKLEVRPILKSAVITSSLFGATDAANIPDHIAIQVAEMFESDIDFHTDLRQGDHFNVIYEGSYEQGELIKTGDVLAAEFINKGKTYTAVGYRDGNGQMHYYTPDGKSLHKSFLRSPLEFTRISSGFSLGRFHPVLQKMRAHKGVDMAAPSGTRIKASGDAVVDFVGQKGGYGNVIVLKHANGISTVYGHLSRFTPGLRRGAKVAQGDVIGFVGMTGLATGPHLHYEFLLNGQHRDPMTVALPKANPLAAQDRAQFAQISNQFSAQLKLLGASNIAALE